MNNMPKLKDLTSKELAKIDTAWGVSLDLQSIKAQLNHEMIESEIVHPWSLDETDGPLEEFYTTKQEAQKEAYGKVIDMLTEFKSFYERKLIAVDSVETPDNK